MCLAIPGEILSIDAEHELLRNARVRFGGVVKEVSLAMVPEAETGQYVLVHAGLAIGVIDEDEAQKLLEDLLQLADAEEEFAP